MTMTPLDSLLEPIKTLNRKELRQFTEFRLKKWPASWQDFLQCFAATETEEAAVEASLFDRKRVLWTPNKHCLIQLDSYFYGEIARPTLEVNFVLSTEANTSASSDKSSSSNRLFFSLYSHKQQQEGGGGGEEEEEEDVSVTTLDRILELAVLAATSTDSNCRTCTVAFESIAISTNGTMAKCPVADERLQQLLLHTNTSIQRLELDRMQFTNSQTTILATTGQETDLVFDTCEFVTPGTFVDAYVASNTDIVATSMTTTGPAKLTFRSNLPFSNRQLGQIIHQPSLTGLSLGRVALSSETIRTLVSATHLQQLGIFDCQMRDEFAAGIFTHALQQQQGPRGLHVEFRGFHHGDHSHFSRFPFESVGQWESMCRAMLTGSGSTEQQHHLTSLTITMRLHHWEDLGDDFLPPLVQALEAQCSSNDESCEGGLQYLSIRNMSAAVANDLIPPVVRVLRDHPSLLKLHFAADNGPQAQQEHLTNAVEDMLVFNRHMEQVHFDSSLYEKMAWRQLVTPRLECNRYQKLFPTLPKHIRPTTRAAIVGTILVRLIAYNPTTTPSATWLLLSDNQDVIAHAVACRVIHNQGIA